MLHFATLFDINYLNRGLCLLESLNKVLVTDFKLYILALDSEVIDYFKKNPNPNIETLTLAEIENEFPELVEAKNNRSKVEYYFTLSPILPLFILKKFENCDRITTLDADIFFYSTPEQLFDDYDQHTVLITPHDFAKNLADRIIYGKYNVSFQSFPNTANGITVLNDWKQQCIAWCKDELDPVTGNFADQKYLDSWTDQYKDIQAINLKTCGRAPWNIGDSYLKLVNKTFMIDGKPLVYYHFHHLRLNGNYIAHGLANYNIFKVNRTIQKMYAVYIIALLKINRSISLFNDFGITRNAGSVEKNLLLQIWRKEIGGVVILNKVLFYNILKIKHIYKQIRIKLNG